MNLGGFIALIVFGIILLFILITSFCVIVSEEQKTKKKNIPAKILLIVLSVYILISMGFIIQFGLHHLKI